MVVGKERNSKGRRVKIKKNNERVVKIKEKQIQETVFCDFLHFDFVTAGKYDFKNRKKAL